MNTAEALARYAALQQELTTLLLLLADEDPDPEAIDACHLRIDAATADFAPFAPAAEDLTALTAAAIETDRLARATAVAAEQCRSELTVRQTQWERHQEAVSAYRPVATLVDARFIDRRG